MSMEPDPSRLTTFSLFAQGYDFDPTYGMDLKQLLAIVPPVPPADFADFWGLRYAAALAVSPQPRVQATGRVLNDYVVHELRYTSTAGVEIGGHLLLPREGKVRRGVVIGHGYGGCGLPDGPLSITETALIYPCFRGLGLSALANVSQDPQYHVLHDIQDKARYILGGCVEDLWLAVSALLELFPDLAGRIAYSGISFGGGIGALAVPWDERIRRLHLQVPTFGHQALRLTLSCTGSGKSLRAFQLQHDFNIMETLAYYDAASAVQYLRIPALVAAARFDPAVPPPGQFAIYNAMPEKLRRLIVLDGGHCDYPDQLQQIQEMNRELISFLMEL